MHEFDHRHGFRGRENDLALVAKKETSNADKTQRKMNLSELPILSKSGFNLRLLSVEGDIFQQNDLVTPLYLSRVSSF